MEGENSQLRSDAIERALAPADAQIIPQSATQEHGERVDSLQQIPSQQEKESPGSLPAPSEGEWIAASLPHPRCNATSIQLRRDEAADKLSLAFQEAENGDKTINSEKLISSPSQRKVFPIPSPPPTPVTKLQEIIPRNERVDRLDFILSITSKVSKQSKKMKRKIALFFKPSDIGRKIEGIEEREEDKTDLLTNKHIEASRTKVLVPQPVKERKEKKPFLGKYWRIRDDDDDDEEKKEMIEKGKTEVRKNSTLPTEKKNADRVSLAPGTRRREVVLLEKKNGPLKVEKGRRLPVIVVRFEGEREGWMYFSIVGFGRRLMLGLSG